MKDLLHVEKNKERQVTVGKNLYGAINPLFQQLYFQVYKDGNEVTRWYAQGER